MEVVDDDLGVRQVAAHRGEEHGAHVDGHVADPVAPGRRLGGQPVGDVVGGAALDLGEHPLPAAEVGESDMPAVGGHPRLRRLGDRRRGRLGCGPGRLLLIAARLVAGCLIGRSPLRAAAANLVDAQDRHRRRSLLG